MVDYIIGLGGSLIVPSGVDTNFLLNFKKLILKRISLGDRFIIIVGGGVVARSFQKSAKILGISEDNDLDWLGIKVTELNAFFLSKFFFEVKNKVLVHSSLTKGLGSSKILFAPGFKPGASTDWVAVFLADFFGFEKVISLSNIDGVYSKDPKFRDSKLLTSLSWKDLKKVVSHEWSPGLNTPIDPKAMKLGEVKGIEFVLLNGSDLNNFEKCLDDKKFKGTVIN